MLSISVLVMFIDNKIDISKFTFKKVPKTKIKHVFNYLQLIFKDRFY